MKKNAEYLFPINLLSYLKQCDGKKTITSDRLNGIEYAIGTLTGIEKQWITLRFRESMSAEDTARDLGLTQEQERNLGNNVKRKLCGTARKAWVLYGIVGNMKRIQEDIRAKAYEEGYHKGFEDSRSGKTPHPYKAAAMTAPIKTLSVSARVLHCLAKSGFGTVGSLLNLDRRAILMIPGMGKKGRKEVVMALYKLGIGNTAWDV